MMYEACDEIRRGDRIHLRRGEGAVDPAAPSRISAWPQGGRPPRRIRAVRGWQRRVDHLRGGVARAGGATAHGGPVPPGRGLRGVGDPGVEPGDVVVRAERGVRSSEFWLRARTPNSALHSHNWSAAMTTLQTTRTELEALLDRFLDAWGRHDLEA